MVKVFTAMTPNSPSAAAKENIAIIASVHIDMFTTIKKVLKVTRRKMSQNHLISAKPDNR
jgi:hypothetical protein